MSDDARFYKDIGEFAGHDTTLHADREFAVAVAENIFSIFKRGLVGTYQHMSEERLHRYLAEFDMRYSTETNTDTERAAAIVAGMVGCHLAYRRISPFAA